MVFPAPIRLSKWEAALIGIGLNRLVAAAATFRVHGRLPFMRPDLPWQPPTFDQGRFDPDLLELVIGAAKAVARIRRGGRLRLDTFQVASCMLGVRLTGTGVRHGHLALDKPTTLRRIRRLLRRLERYRKRQKRVLIAAEGGTSYGDRASQWTAFVRWVRLNFGHCGCGFKAPFSQWHKFRRQFISKACDLARSELRERRQKAPPPKRLRQLVRLALRYVDRGRGPFGFRELANSSLRTRDFLANFITTRLKKEKQQKERQKGEKSCRRSLIAERLRALH